MGIFDLFSKKEQAKDIRRNELYQFSSFQDKSAYIN